MTTEFDRYLPQQKGALVANDQANELPDGSPKQMDLIAIRNAGLDVGEMITNASPSNGKKQGRLNSRRVKKPSPQKRVDRIAQKMLEAGRTPQEIGAVVAGILGFKG